MIKRRIAIKVSGDYTASEIAGVIDPLSEVVNFVVICGGGNILRGRDSKDNRMYEDRIGIASTFINSVRLKCALAKKSTIFSTNIESDVSYKYNLDAVNDRIEQDEIPILAGGLGCGYLSTDTTLMIRALELECSCAVKITKVGGVYDRDPKIFEDAKMLDRISYDEAIHKGAFDSIAGILAQQNQLPFLVLALEALDSYVRFDDYSKCTIIE